MAQYSIWAGAVPPSAGASQSAVDNAVTLGTIFNVSTAINATHVRFFIGAGWVVGAATPDAVAIYDDSSNTPLASAGYSGTPSAGAWTDVALGPVSLVAGTRYVAAVHYPNSCRYPNESAYFNGNAVTSGPLTAPDDGSVPGGNGRYDYGASIVRPTSTFQQSSYFADVIVADTVVPDVLAYTRKRMRASAY